MNTDSHDHRHAENRFAVIPTPVRLNADARYTGKGITIAFLDSGFYPHPDLTEPENRIHAFQDITGRRSSLDSKDVPEGWQWHGTQTSVAAAGNGFLSNGTYHGLAPDANVVLVNVSDMGKIPEENIAAGLEWIIANKERYYIRIVSISLGGDEDVPYLQNRVDQLAEQAVRQGLILVVAAGNAGCTDRYHPVPPANAPSVITVGGYDDKNQLSDSDPDLYCSSFGPTVDGILKPEIIAPAMWIAAPILPNTSAYRRAEALSLLAAAPDYLLASLAAKLWRSAEFAESISGQFPDEIRANVESIIKRNKLISTHYQHVDGTSFAAPIVSSVVAQMLEANPDLTPALVKNILISTATRIRNAPVLRQGYGVLNARAAVEQALREHHQLLPGDLLPPRVAEGRMIFFYHDDSAETVMLAGDFNNWNTSVTPFVLNGSGIWMAGIDLPSPGRYRYKFLVNGNRWIDDPANGLKEPDNYGGLNSVIQISE